MGSFDCIMFFVCIFQAKVAIRRGATAVVVYVAILLYRNHIFSCVPEDLPVLYFGSIASQK